MGTNYYVKSSACHHCGHRPEAIHIGKSSAGWVFALNTHPEMGINNIADWLAYLADKEITDEYGGDVSLGKLIETICGRKGEMRRSHDARRGEGTWDYHCGDFS